MRHTLYVFSLLFLIACQQKKTEVLEIAVRSAIESNEATILLSEIAKHITYIPLETREEGLLRGVNKVYMTDSFIWVSDYSKLLQFDTNGKFIRRIGKTGNGPGELGRRIRFDIDEEASQIYIHSHRDFIFVFDLHSGKYKRRFQVQNNVNRIAVLGDGKLGTFSYDGKVLSKEDVDFYEVLIFDQSGICIDSIPDATRLIKQNQENIDLHKMILGYPEVTKNEAGILYKSVYQDTLWQLTRDRDKSPYLVVKTNNPYSARELEIDPNATEMQFPDMLSVHKTLEFKDHIFLNVEKGYKRGRNRDLRRVLYAKNKDKSIMAVGLKEDLQGGPEFWPEFITGGKMIDKVEALDLIEYYKQNRSDKKMSEEFKALVSNLSVESNPVLVVVE